MPKALALSRTVSVAEIDAHLADVTDEIEQTRCEALKLVVLGGMTRSAVAKSVGRHPRWLSQTISQFNAEGFAGLRDKRADNGAASALSTDQFQQLAVALAGEPEGGGWWSDSKVKDWIAEHFDITIHRCTANVYLRQLGYRRVKPAEETVDPPPDHRAPFADAAQRNATTTAFADTPYPTDLTDAQWALLRPLLPPAQTQPHLREVVNAILYVLRTGCPWQFLPRDFPPLGTVTTYFYRWRDEGVWEQIVHALRPAAREQLGRNPEPTAALIDSQSVKTTEKGGLAATTAARKSKEESGIS